MAIRFDNIEAESLLNSQGELTITLTDDQGISVPGDVFSDGLYVNAGSAVSGTQVAIVKDGEQNLQRWGSSTSGQASYRFRVDQDFKFIGNSGSGDTITLNSSDGTGTFTGALSASNLSGTNTGDQDLSSYLTTVAFSDLTGKPTTLSGYGIIDAVSLGLDNVFTGDNEFEGDLLRTNQRISNNQEYPLGHYTPGETVFELDPTWSNRELRQYFGNSNVSWDEVANAPGGYAVYINGGVSVGGAYNSGFPYIPIDQDGIYYMEVWIKNAGTAQGHYMGSIDYEADFSAPASGSGNPGSYGYWVMSNYTGAAEWTKKSGYITGHHNSNVGAFETDATYWTPQALFNYSAGTGTRACWISGWKVIRVDHVGDRTFQDDVVVKGKLEVHTLDANSSSTTALVMNGNEVEKRTLGSNAFNSTSFLTSVDWTDIGAATRTNYTLKFKPPANSYAGFQFIGTDDQNAGYFLIRGTSDNDVYGAEGITLVADQGWLTLAQRYGTNKGVRFMTGSTTASTRMTIATDGDVNINNNLTVGVDLAVNGNIKDNDYKHAGSDLWLTKKYIRSVGLSGASIGDAWVHLARVAIASSYGKLAVKFTIHGYDDVSSGTEVIDAIYENGASAQENHGCQWYSLDNNANLFKAVRSIRSSSSGTDNSYDIYVQMAGDWRDTFTVVAEYWRTGTNQSITFLSSTGSATEPGAGTDDIQLVERRWFTQNSYMYTGGGNRVYTTGDFTNNSSNWDTAYTHSQAAHAPSNAEQNVQSDWNATSGDAFIQNKPTIPTLSSLGALSTSGGTMTGALNASGGLYFVGDTHMGFVPYPIGAQFRSDSSNHTGYIKIKLPTDITNTPDDMVSFHVDIYDYTTNEMISVFVGGYTYRTTSVATYWYNCTAIITAGKTDKNFTVRFGNDGTNYYVAIGETTSTWAHPSIIVRDVQCSYRSNVVHYVDGWDIDITAAELEGVDETRTDNFPVSDYNKMINAPSLLEIGTTATTAMAGNTSLFDGNYSSLSGIPSTFAPSSHNHDDLYHKLDFATITGAHQTDVKSGTWTGGEGASWGSYKPGNDSNAGYYYNDGTGYAQYNIPSGYTTAYIGQLKWSSGGYFDVYAVDSNGNLVLRGRYMSLQSIENTNHNGNHDYQQIIKISGLDGFSAIRIQNRVGRIHLQGIGWTKEEDTDSTADALSHWDLIYNKPTTFAPSSHSHSDATTSASGFMSSTDKTKLDGVATGADVTPSWVPANDPSYLTSETFGSSDVVMSLSGNDITAGASITLAGGLSYNASTNTLSQTDSDTVYTHPTTAGNKHIPTGGAAGQFLKYSSSGTAVWATPSYTTNTDTTYSAGSGLDLTSTTFSVEPDLRDGITHVGKDANNYITFDSTNGRIDFYAGGVFVARMESDGDLHIKGDVIAYSDIFS